MENPLVSIVLLNWNGTKFIFDCIKSIYNQTYQNLEVIVVDNNSTDDSIKKILKENNTFKYILNKDNLGFAKGMNVGIHKSKGKYVLLLNYDIFMHENFVEECVRVAEKYPDIGAVGGQAFFWTNGELTNEKQHSVLRVANYIRGLHIKTYEPGSIIPSVHGSFPFIRKAALDDIYYHLGEYYDPDFITSWEDTDLWFRLMLYGWKKIYWPKAYVWHYGSAAWDGKKGLYNNL